MTGGGSSTISRISRDIVNDQEVLVIADNGSEGNVILDSAQALLQGLYPPTSESRSRLANGTTVVGPFNGYQYIPSTYSKAQFSITCVLNIIIPLQLSPLSPSRVSSWKAGLIVLYAI